MSSYLMCGNCGTEVESKRMAVVPSRRRDGWQAIRCEECGGMRAALRAEQRRESRLRKAAAVDGGSCAAPGPWSVGDRVEGGERGTDDYDTGTVLRLGSRGYLIGWDSCQQTWAEANELRAVSDRD